MRTSRLPTVCALWQPLGVSARGGGGYPPGYSPPHPGLTHPQYPSPGYSPQVPIPPAYSPPIPTPDLLTPPPPWTDTR